MAPVGEVDLRPCRGEEVEAEVIELQRQSDTFSRPRARRDPKKTLYSLSSTLPPTRLKLHATRGYADERTRACFANSFPTRTRL